MARERTHYFKRIVEKGSTPMYRGSTDGEGYRGGDSGCEKATLFLGYPSRCLINCPFPAECILKEKDDKLERIKAGGKNGS